MQLIRKTDQVHVQCLLTLTNLLEPGELVMSLSTIDKIVAFLFNVMVVLKF